MNKAQRDKMLSHWRRTRRQFVEMSLAYASIGDDDDSQLFANAASDVQKQIAHVVQGKPPPLPPTPALEFLLETEKFHEEIRFRDWEARQKHLTNPPPHP